MEILRSDRQGPDFATQYRSAIFYHDADQDIDAQAATSNLERAIVFPRPIVTQIVPAGEFYRVEKYHQKYLEKQGLRSCHLQ